MQQSSRLAGLLQERIDSLLLNHRQELSPLGPDVPRLLDSAGHFLTGGKRFRAQFAYWGFNAIDDQSIGADSDPNSGALNLVLELGASLELFHAAALVHDDIIDNSDTRRGNPAVHRSFAQLHETGKWQGDASRFGIAAAILLGDLLQSWSDEAFMNATLGCDTPEKARRGRAHFNRMRSEVASGQYLDVLEEQQGIFAPDSEQVERATRVLVFKSAKYSVEAPLLIGAACAGASPAQEQQLRDFGLPVGMAFQLRDDVLGVFGDSDITGKPSGDDLREGKRTVLIALTRQRLGTSTRRIFDDLIGDPDLTLEQVGMLQRTIRETGALDTVEETIQRNLSRGLEALHQPGLTSAAVAELSRLADRATTRNS